ncbi:MAG: hypothetical protein RR791_05210, partial [Lachnospiraceae bacterium]
MDEAKFVIDGVLLPTPSSVKVNIEDLDSEGSMRPVSTGIMDRDVIRQGMISFELSYNLSDFPDVMKILNMTKPKDFNVELFIPSHGLRGTLKMYSAKKAYEYKATQNGLKA